MILKRLSDRNKSNQACFYHQNKTDLSNFEKKKVFSVSHLWGIKVPRCFPLFVFQGSNTQFVQICFKIISQHEISF